MNDAKNHTVAHVLGEITWLLSQSPAYKQLRIGDLEWAIMPALLLKQFCIFYDEQKKPIAFALWAYLSPEVEKRMSESLQAGKPTRLGLKEWKSGESLWLLELVSPFATAQNQLQDKLLAELKTRFPKKPFHYMKVNATSGKRELARMDPKEMAHA